MNAAGKDTSKISPTSTKKEILDAYNELVNKLKEQAKAELKPEKVKEERKAREVVQAADVISADPVSKRLGDLKAEIGKELSEVAAKLEDETSRYNRIKAAIELKDQELKEIFDIERSAFALAALLESQKQKKQEYETEIEGSKKRLEDEIQQTRAQWEKEKQQYLEALKEQKKEDEKSRKRENEEYQYVFKREQELRKTKLKDEIEALEKDIQKKRDDFEQSVSGKQSELQQRETAIAEREKLLTELQARVDAFPKEMEVRVNRAVKEAVDAARTDAKKNEELLVKGFEGEKNVLQARIDALEKMAAFQNRQIDTLSKQLEKAYEKVQDIAIKAVSRPQAFTNSQRTVGGAESEKG